MERFILSKEAEQYIRSRVEGILSGNSLDTDGSWSLLPKGVNQPLLSSVNTAVQHIILHALNSCRENVRYGNGPKTRDHVNNQVQELVPGTDGPHTDIQGSAVSTGITHQEPSRSTRPGEHPKVAEGLVPEDDQLIKSIDMSVSQSSQSLIGVGYGFDSLDFDSEFLGGDMGWKLHPFSEDNILGDLQLLE